MAVRISEQPFEPWAVLAEFEREHPELEGKSGATAVFIGSMRDFNEGDDVTGMTLEHYPAMTQQHLEKIVTQARNQWDIDDVLLVHRVGDLVPGDPIVLVAVWSAHRAASYEANRYLMEELKSTAPFWKKEQLSDGERWVESNTPGYTNRNQG